LTTSLGEERQWGGNWRALFGALGYVIVNEATNLPASLAMSLVGAEAKTWTGNTSEQRALQKSRSNGRIAAAWTNSNSFTLSLNSRDGGLYRLGLYCLDWDTSNQRVQRLDFIDPQTGTVLVSHVLSNFSSGVYLTLSLRGDLDL